jgi:hypothetical protein
MSKDNIRITHVALKPPKCFHCKKAPAETQVAVFLGNKRLPIEEPQACKKIGCQMQALRAAEQRAEEYLKEQAQSGAEE